jgi:hypothetical protein
MADGTVRISFMLGKQLLCRKPITRIRVSCFHPKWWQKLLGAPDSCGEIPPMIPPPVREMFVLDESACRHARLSVDRLPSYHDREAMDRRLHPNAIPCGCPTDSP